MGDGMNMKSEFNRRRARPIWCGLAAVVLVVGMAAQAARAADDEDDNELPDTKFFRGVLQSFGLRPGEGSGIDYRERSPLVVPPDLKLPPPEKNNIAVKDPAWPKDADAQRAKKAKANRPAYNPEPEEDGRPMRPSEYNPVGAARRTRDDSLPTGQASANPDGIAEAARPELLGSKGIGSIFQKTEEYVTFRNEPARANLTDPPAGYRTPSPNQPYGIGKQRWTPGSTPDRNDAVR